MHVNDHPRAGTRVGWLPPAPELPESVINLTFICIKMYLITGRYLLLCDDSRQVMFRWRALCDIKCEFVTNEIACFSGPHSEFGSRRFAEISNPAPRIIEIYFKCAACK